MKIFLIGLPGCGKSTLGKKVADLLDRPFVDLDVEIVKGEKQSVESIFNARGENQFRVIEKNYLIDWCQHTDDYVMATGGGTPCYFSNMDLINRSGISIFIDTNVNEIANRMLKTELATRPLFAGQDASTISARVEEMRNQRIGFYKQAQLTLSGSDITPNQIIKNVQALKG